MKKQFAVVIILIAVVSFFVGHSHVHAQTTTTPLAITVAGVHTSCLPAATGTTTFCFASDGLWQSLNGAAYTQLGGVGPAGPAGATGPMGPAGATGPAGPAGGVTSVNGKTGTVVLSATTSLN